MNKLDLDYQNLLKDILENGVKKETRNGGTISVFGRQIRHKMSDGFPLLTTKKMPFKTIVTELLWFLRGDTNIKYLVDNNCHIWDGDAYKNWCNHYRKENNGLEPWPMEIWLERFKTDDEFAETWGELGPIYGKQWRKWKSFEHEYGEDENDDGFIGMWKGKEKIDQIQNLINDLKTNPDSRRLMVNAWNVGELDQMVLPPCHYGFQVYTRELSFDEFWDRLTPKQKGNMEKPYEGETYNGIDSRIEFKNIASEVHNLPTRAISLMWNQRSVDTFLGLPFNIASYGLLLEIIAKEVNMVPDELIGNLGDVHLYSNHIEQAKEQIGREFTEEEIIEHLQQSGMDALKNEPRMEYISKLPKRTREPFPLPTIKVSGSWKFLSSSPCFGDTIQHKDIELENYQSHPTIKAPLSN